MNGNELQRCHDTLKAKYILLKGKAFEFSSDIKSSIPSWHLLSKHDLQNITSQEAYDSPAALLKDPDIGVLYYLIPFHTTDDIKAQIAKALEIRSGLLPDSNYNPDAQLTDDSGSWHVVICWLITSSLDYAVWLKTVSSLRKDTAYMEEIPVDCIVCTDGNWEYSVEQHEFARLFFITRRALSMQNESEMFKWMSADDAVKRKMQDFPVQFKDRDQQQCAELVKEIALKSQSKDSESESITPSWGKELSSLEIRNFRNITNLSLHFSSDRAEALILHGPNGTGKSSVFEALSLITCGTSHRYHMFLKDKDITARTKTSTYIDKYLKRKSPDQSELSASEPTIKINNIDDYSLIDDTSISSTMIRKINGTFISQEGSSDFSKHNASDLAVEVLGGYSELAAELKLYIEDQYDKTNNIRKEFLSQLGLASTIKKTETAYNRITLNILKADPPHVPPALMIWMEKIISWSDKSMTDLISLHTKWEQWEQLETPTKAAEVASTIDEMRKVVFDHLHTYDMLRNATLRFMEKFNDDYLSEVIDISVIGKQLEVWGRWLASQNQQTPEANPERARELESDLSNLKKSQATIHRTDKLLRARLDNFETINSSLSHWLKEKPDECITCGTNLADKQGLVRVMSDLKTKAEYERTELLKQNEQLSAQIADKQKELDLLSIGGTPLSDEERLAVMKPFSWFMDDSSKFAQYIVIEDNRISLIELLKTLKHVPLLQVVADPQEESTRIAERIMDKINEFEIISKAPDHWDAVKKAYMKSAGSIVEEYIPQHLGGLWREIALNLTPAPWLLPGKFAFSISTTTREHKVTIDIDKERRALYILNQAEIHTLGLGWFFTRYLTHGRFHYNFIVMDDPAQEMDQATYRDICRLWETLIRLHRINKLPLSLLIMLHQESRAMDAARATNGQLCVLGWNSSQEESETNKTVTFFKLLGDGFKSVKPEKVLT